MSLSAVTKTHHDWQISASDALQLLTTSCVPDMTGAQLFVNSFRTSSCDAILQTLDRKGSLASVFPEFHTATQRCIDTDSGGKVSVAERSLMNIKQLERALSLDIYNFPDSYRPLLRMSAFAREFGSEALERSLKVSEAALQQTMSYLVFKPSECSIMAAWIQEAPGMSKLIRSSDSAWETSQDEDLPIHRAARETYEKLRDLSARDLSIDLVSVVEGLLCLNHADVFTCEMESRLSYDLTEDWLEIQTKWEKRADRAAELNSIFRSFIDRPS